MIEKSRQNAKREAEAERERARQVKDETKRQVQEFLGEISDGGNGSAELLKTSTEPTYVRPIAELYRFADVAPIFTTQYLVDAPTATVATTILQVVEIEAPLHMKDLTARVAAKWGQKPAATLPRESQKSVKCCIKQSD